jgi:hypothetical protein
MALRKTVARWFTVWLCPPSRFAQPQPMSSGSASCLQQTRFQTVCASRCYLTDGLGLQHMVPRVPSVDVRPGDLDLRVPHRHKWANSRERVSDPRIGWLPVRCRGRRPERYHPSGDFSAQHVGQLPGAFSNQRLHSEDRVQHGSAGIGRQCVGRQSDWRFRLFDLHGWRAAANGLVLVAAECGRSS